MQRKHDEAEVSILPTAIIGRINFHWPLLVATLRIDVTQRPSELRAYPEKLGAPPNNIAAVPISYPDVQA